MLYCKRLLTARCVGILAIVVLTLAPVLMADSATSVAMAARLGAVSGTISAAERTQTAQLPDWLLRLNLSDTQMRQVFEIDALLEQQIQFVLTERQYSQWRSSQAILSNQSWNFEDLNIALSPYQQVAIDESFRLATQRLIDMLSIAQKQQLMQYLSDENIIPDSSFETDVEI